MKKQLLSISFLICVAFFGNAQTVFWTEGFSTGCNQGVVANGFSGSNGAWATTSTGTNDPYANVFFVSATEAYTGFGGCGDGCLATPSQVNGTLHLGNVAIPGLVSADNGASYNVGGICGFGYCVITNTRAESPVIDCSGKSSITLSLEYFENGDLANDDGSVWYYNGFSWALLSNTAKTAAICPGGQGLWTTFSIALPADANNNPNVKIGFNWTNNDDNVGTDPSFAIDNITLSVPVSVGVTEASQSLQVYSTNGEILLKGNQSYQINGLHDILGRTISFTKNGNTLRPAGEQGIYFLTLTVDGKVITKKIFLQK